MTKYKCGHKCDTIIMNENLLAISSYLTWKDDTGFDGDNSMCFDCWIEKFEKPKTRGERMKPQPLKKENSEQIGRGVEPKTYRTMFFESDIASAMAWLKEKLFQYDDIEPREYKQIITFIDEAFIGIVEPKPEAKE